MRWAFKHASWHWGCWHRSLCAVNDIYILVYLSEQLDSRIPSLAGPSRPAQGHISHQSLGLQKGRDWGHEEGSWKAKECLMSCVTGVRPTVSVLHRPLRYILSLISIWAFFSLLQFKVVGHNTLFDDVPPQAFSPSAPSAIYHLLFFLHQDTYQPCTPEHPSSCSLFIRIDINPAHPSIHPAVLTTHSFVLNGHLFGTALQWVV